MISDLVNKYEKCRKLAKNYGSVIILKDNQPDTVLLSIDEFERLSGSQAGVADLLMRLPKAGGREVYTLSQLKNDLNRSNTREVYNY